MKAILISIKPKYVADILNGNKTIEIRKTMPKCDLPIDVYIYCTKCKKGSFCKENGCVGYRLDGYVVAKFTLNKVEEIHQNYQIELGSWRYYEIKAVFREDRPDTDYAFITFDKKLSFQGTQVLDTSDNFFDFLRNGDSVQFRHIGGWFEIYSPYRGCLFIVSGHKEYKTKNKEGEDVVYLNPIYTKVHDEMIHLITGVKKNFKIQGCEGKQRQYTQEQIGIMKVLLRFELYAHNNDAIKREIKEIKKEYDIKEPYLTLRDYINKHCCGAYHTFHFTLANKKISIDTIGDMLTDEWCDLYPLTNKFYVAADNSKSQGSHCENYHCDHYLTLEPKEN